MWLLKSMTERREPSVHAALIIFLKLVAFVSG